MSELNITVRKIPIDPFDTEGTLEEKYSGALNHCRGWFPALQENFGKCTGKNEWSEKPTFTFEKIEKCGVRDLLVEYVVTVEAICK